jgi:hypothetical protein
MNPVAVALAVSVALSAYVAAYLEVTTIENGPLYWLIVWGALKMAMSYAWKIFLTGGYTEDQKVRLGRSISQDYYITGFSVGLAGTLHRIQMLERGTIGEPVVFLMPLADVWFGLNSKYLTHIWVGTPFHPTWWCDGQMPAYAKNDLVNFIFACSTILLTLVLTTYAFFCVNTALETWNLVSATISSETPLWKVFGSHGVLLIWHSGMWMAASSTGSPAWAKSLMFTFIPPFLPANPHECIPCHLYDLAFGIMLMLVASVLDAETTPSTAVAAGLGFAWLVTFIWKARIHINGVEWKRVHGKLMQEQKTK